MRRNELRCMGEIVRGTKDREDYGNGGESVRMIPKSTHVINSDDSEEELDL